MDAANEHSAAPHAERFDPVAAARRLVREATTGALATLSPSGAPYASLVTVGTLPDGAPILLLSGLALHTKNILADSRVSLLVDERRTDDPLQGARVSLSGTIARIDDASVARWRFLARHPSAEGFSSFKDFAFYRIEVEHAHLVAGFGRIVDVTGADLSTDLTDAAELLATEVGSVEHMNDDHRDATQLYATGLLGAAPGDWRLIGLDPDGCDIACGEVVRRVDFDQPAVGPHGYHKALIALVQKARAKAA